MKKKYCQQLLLVILVIGLISSIILTNLPVQAMSSEPQSESTTANKSNQEEEYGLEVGKLAPLFSLSNLKGEEVSLKDLRGKYVLLNFWAAWCPPCRAEMPDLNKFHQNNKEEFIVVGVNLADKTKVVIELVNQNGYDYPILLDHNKDIGSRYRVSAIPTSYVIDPQGKIKSIKRGLITREELQEIKSELLEGK